MSAMEKRTAPIASARMSFDKQKGLSNSATKSAAFADFFLLKEQIRCPPRQYRLDPPPP